MSKLSNVWVFSDTYSRLAEVISGGLELGENVKAIVLTEDESKEAFAYGANEVFLIENSDSNNIVENYSKSIAKVIMNEGKSLILMPGTKRCKSLASLLSIELEAGLVTEVSEINIENNNINCRHMVYGGLANGLETITSEASIAVIASGTFENTQKDESKTGEAQKVDFVENKNSIKCIEKTSKEGSSVDLNKAKSIVAIGRGISKQEDISLAEELCKVMDAELGCSRPIAEGEKWMEHERYIGISSVMAKPEIYVAIGISGQIQHMVGAKDSQTIIAINKDKNAPIFDYADYGIVGDLYTVLPAVTKALKG
ncbi:FAD-binding protein [Malaciobacter marinus]|uniref:FAD-binding protein n=1 Tax=Malaciobacter marinus TaxID=505249 RepID=UPI003AFFA0B7